MSNRTLYTLVALVLIGIGVMFFINLLPVLKADNKERYIRLNDVKGMAVVYQGKEYTLNFDQQNEVAVLLNQSEPISKENLGTLSPAPFEKIIIYQFKGSNLDLSPIGFKSRNLIYSNPKWNPEGYLQEVSSGTLKDIIESTYPK